MKKSFWLDHLDVLLKAVNQECYLKSIAELKTLVVNVIGLFYDIQSSEYSVFLVHFAPLYKVIIEEFI